MLFYKAWQEVFDLRPLELLFGLCLLVTVAAGGVVHHASSSSLAILVLVSLFYLPRWPRFWRSASAVERLVFSGFALYFFSALLAYWNVEDVQEYVKVLDRYFRFLTIIPVYMLVTDMVSQGRFKPFPFLLAGALLSGPIYLGASLFSLVNNPGMPATGYYHHITFGGMAMINAVFLSTVLMMKRTGMVGKLVLITVIACLVVATVYSQSRSAWLSLFVSMILLVIVAVLSKRVSLRTIVASLLIMGAVIMLSPARDLIDSRIETAVEEVEMFTNIDRHDTSIGMRFVMWDIAIDTWKKHPVIGTGPADFDIEMERAQAEGRYVESQIFESTHNIFFQALADTGTIGFLILMAALFVFPLRLFYRAFSDGEQLVSVIGMAVLTAFAVLGLTETWTWRAPVVSVYLVYFVALATIIGRKEALSH